MKLEMLLQPKKKETIKNPFLLLNLQKNTVQSLKNSSLYTEMPLYAFCMVKRLWFRFFGFCMGEVNKLQAKSNQEKWFCIVTS